jgi:hypothetical protein
MSSLVLSLLATAGILNAVSAAKDLTDDGRVFTFDQKDYKVPKFDLYGREFDDTQGFAGASYLPLDNKGYNEVCTLLLLGTPALVLMWGGRTHMFVGCRWLRLRGRRSSFSHDGWGCHFGVHSQQ